MRAGISKSGWGVLQGVRVQISGGECWRQNYIMHYMVRTAAEDGRWNGSGRKVVAVVMDHGWRFGG
jgi:hypothetical protein